MNGIVVAEAETFLAAVAMASARGANPGGQVAGAEIPVELLDALPVDQLTAIVTLPRYELLTLEDCKRHGLDMVRWKDGATV